MAARKIVIFEEKARILPLGPKKNEVSMKITRKNPFTGKNITRDIPVTQAQLDNWNNGKLIQDAMPNLSADDREFILTGILLEQWEDMFKGEY